MLTVVLISHCEKDKESNKFKDARDGQIYRWVKIGDQIWMAENLAYLPAVSPPTSESFSEPIYYVTGYQGTSVIEAKATTNYQTYGVLYNWPAAAEACPAGWHLPTDAEWKQLEIYLGMSSADVDGTDFRGLVVGGKLKETGTTHWNSPNTAATNETGFTALPAGYRYLDNSFKNFGNNADFWTSTEQSSLFVWFRMVNYDHGGIFRDYKDKPCGFSVRCIKDNPE